MARSCWTCRCPWTGSRLGRTSARQRRWGMAASAHTHGWLRRGPGARSTRRCAEKWTRRLEQRSSGDARSISAWARGAVRRGPVSPASWLPTGRGRTSSATTAGRLPSTGCMPRFGAPSGPAGHKDVLVLGADVARPLLRADLLDEVRIHLVPLLLGEGTPLFAGEQAGLIAEGKPVAGTVTHLRFRVVRWDG